MSRKNAVDPQMIRSLHPYFNYSQQCQLPGTRPDFLYPMLFPPHLFYPGGQPGLQPNAVSNTSVYRRDFLHRPIPILPPLSEMSPMCSSKIELKEPKPASPVDVTKSPSTCAGSPPRSPAERSDSNNSPPLRSPGDSKESSKRIRTAFTSTQLLALEREFKMNW